MFKTFDKLVEIGSDKSFSVQCSFKNNVKEIAIFGVFEKKKVAIISFGGDWDIFDDVGMVKVREKLFFLELVSTEGVIGKDFEGVSLIVKRRECLKDGEFAFGDFGGNVKRSLKSWLIRE